jgi:hypothetical protein
MFGHNMQEYIQGIIDLAKEVETTDPIDWDTISISEDDAYNLVALNVLEQVGVQEIKGDIYFDMEKDIMVATIVKLVVENFALNLKLTQKEKDGN